MILKTILREVQIEEERLDESRRNYIKRKKNEEEKR